MRRMCQSTSRLGEADHAGVTLPIESTNQKSTGKSEIPPTYNQVLGELSEQNVDGENKLSPITSYASGDMASASAALTLRYCGISSDGRYRSS